MSVNEIIIGKRKLSLEKPLIMGILNVTPDSFSDGGEFIDVEKSVAHAKEMISSGADIIDVGGESSRPGSEPVSSEEELKRVLPVVSRLVKELNVPISIDTYKASVAEECVKVGASIINDISGLGDEMRAVAAKYKVAVVIMHMLGSPKTMQKSIVYDDVVDDIKKFLKERVDKAKSSGISTVMVDPGIGFGKTTEDNLEIIRRLYEFESLGCPVLVGPSRKSFIGNITGLPVEERLGGTITSVVVSVMNGAKIIRVHDVKECKSAIDVANAINADEDKIVVKDARFLCNLGVSESERKDKQEILVDIEMFVKKVANSDSIDDTINYSDVVKKVKETVSGKEHNLIETIVGEIADVVLNNFDVNRVKVRVKKPNAIKEAKYAAVEIIRRRDG